MQNTVIPMDKNIFIYGAGGVAKDIYKLISSKDETIIKGFVVTNKNNNPEKIYAKTIYTLEEINRQFDNDIFIVVAVSSSAGIDVEELLGREDINHVLYSDVVRELYKSCQYKGISYNKIVLSNFHGRGLGGNVKYIVRELLNRPKILDLVIAIENSNIVKNDKWLKELIEESKNKTSNRNVVRTVEYGTYDYYHELATAKVWVDNTHKNLLSRKREGQYYIQTWHGVGPFKRIEHDAGQLPDSYLRMADADVSMTDLYISPGQFNTEQFRRAFRFKGEILECGYPRNDIFINKNLDADQIRRNLDIALDSVLVLYAPTVRETDDDNLIPDYKVICEAIEQRYHRKCQIIVRFHPDVASEERTVGYENVIIDVTEYPDIQELLYISDILITDYSSVMWDFSLQRRPVFLFHPDNEAFSRERGFYLDADELPYMEVVSNEDLYDQIISFDEEAYLNQLEDFFMAYSSFDTGRASEQVADRILEVIECRG